MNYLYTLNLWLYSVWVNIYRIMSGTFLTLASQILLGVFGYSYLHVQELKTQQQDKTDELLSYLRKKQNESTKEVDSLDVVNHFYTRRVEHTRDFVSRQIERNNYFSRNGITPGQIIQSIKKQKESIIHERATIEAYSYRNTGYSFVEYPLLIETLDYEFKLVNSIFLLFSNSNHKFMDSMIYWNDKLNENLITYSEISQIKKTNGNILNRTPVEMHEKLKSESLICRIMASRIDEINEEILYYKILILISSIIYFFLFCTFMYKSYLDNTSPTAYKRTASFKP